MAVHEMTMMKDKQTMRAMKPPEEPLILGVSLFKRSNTLFRCTACSRETNSLVPSRHSTIGRAGIFPGISGGGGGRGRRYGCMRYLNFSMMWANEKGRNKAKNVFPETRPSD